MSQKKLFVTTNPENGWDCVGQIFLAPNEAAVRAHLDEERDGPTEDDIFIHEKHRIIELE